MSACHLGQVDLGAGHSKGLLIEQDVSIHRSSSVVTELRQGATSHRVPTGRKNSDAIQRGMSVVIKGGCFGAICVMRRSAGLSSPTGWMSDIIRVCVFW